MEINKDEFVEKFIDAHPELFLEFKWAALFALLEESDIWEGKETLKRQTIDFLEVFHKHDVDPEVVMEAMMVIMDQVKGEAKPTADMSKEELTNFVSTLMKIRKQQEEDEEKEENDA